MLEARMKDVRCVVVSEQWMNLYLQWTTSDGNGLSLAKCRTRLRQHRRTNDERKTTSARSTSARDETNAIFFWIFFLMKMSLHACQHAIHPLRARLCKSASTLQRNVLVFEQSSALWILHLVWGNAGEPGQPARQGVAPGCVDWTWATWLCMHKSAVASVHVDRQLS